MRARTAATPVIVSLAMTLCAGCGSHAATAPGTVVLPLRPGLQLLTLTGFVASADPAFPPCAPVGQPRDGTAVATVVNLTADGQEWVARSAAPGGSVELRLHGTGSSASGYAVAGTIAGSAVDSGLNGVVRDVSVTLTSASGTGAATFDGSTASPTSSFVVGRAAGTLRFSDSQGRSSSCSAIQWSMQPF